MNDKRILFKDRLDAGKQLCMQLSDYVWQETPLILALPRGGIPIGAVLSDCLQAPMRAFVCKKIGHPANPEFAIGAICPGYTYLEPGLTLDPDILEPMIRNLRTILLEQQEKWHGIEWSEVQDRHLLLTDDGMATGSTVIAAVRALAQAGPASLRVALPVASQEAMGKLQSLGLTDDIICLTTPHDLIAIGMYYRDFEQVEDALVYEMLSKNEYPDCLDSGQITV